MWNARLWVVEMAGACGEARIVPGIYVIHLRHVEYEVKNIKYQISTFWGFAGRYVYTSYVY